jgi:hypothetical protein
LRSKGRQHAADVGHDRLHLDDQQRSARRVVREDVDGAARSVDVERGFGDGLPAVGPESLHHAIDETGMSSVSKTVKRFALVQDPHG